MPEYNGEVVSTTKEYTGPVVAQSGKAATQAEPSLMDKLAGVGEVALTLGTGAIAAPVGAAAGIVAGVTNPGFGTPQGARDAAQTAADTTSQYTYAPRTEKGKEYVGEVGKALDSSKLAGLGPTEALTLGAAARPSASAGALKKGAGQAAASAGQSVEAGLLRQGVSKIGTALTPNISPEVVSLAKKAQEMGIPLRPDMLSDNRVLRMMGEAFERVPLSGSGAETRQTAFNKGLMKLIGADEKETKLTPLVFDKALTQAGEKIGEISKSTPIPLDAPLREAIAAQVKNASRFETNDVAKIINSYAEEIQSKAENGVIPGEAYRKLNSKIGAQMRNTSNGDLKNALGELQGDMHEALARNIGDKEKLLELNEARTRYAIAKAVEPLVAKSSTGDISPQGLMQAATSDKSKKSMMARGRGGEFGDLARIGQRFMKEPNSSGTAERGLAYGVMGGAGVTHPATAGSVYALANLYNRLGPRLSQRLTGVTQDGLKKAKLNP